MLGILFEILAQFLRCFLCAELFVCLLLYSKHADLGQRRQSQCQESKRIPEVIMIFVFEVMPSLFSRHKATLYWQMSRKIFVDGLNNGLSIVLRLISATMLAQ